jgi:class 3 adenylate cyclase
MGGTRKIAAILVADVVGYSRLAGPDEDRTLSRLRGLRSDLIDPAVDAHHGRIVKRTGDGSPHPVPQRGRRRALRHRGPERHGRTQCRPATGAPH